MNEKSTKVFTNDLKHIKLGIIIFLYCILSIQSYISIIEVELHGEIVLF